MIVHSLFKDLNPPLYATLSSCHAFTSKLQNHVASTLLRAADLRQL